MEAGQDNYDTETWQSTWRTQLIKTYITPSSNVQIIRETLHPETHDKNLISDHQFGFRAKHSTVEQVHRDEATTR